MKVVNLPAAYVAGRSVLPGGRYQPPRVLETLVPRVRLLQRLLQVHDKVCLLVGPPGSGKSTLLVELYVELASQGRAVRWLTLGCEDNDPDVLRDHLIRAFDLDVGRDGELPGLGGGLAGFVDGLECLSDARALALLERFMLTLAPGACLLVTSCRLRGAMLHDGLLRGLVQVVNAVDLRMDDAEAAVLLGESWTSDEVQRLNRVVDGWAAGLRFLVRAPEVARSMLESMDGSAVLPPEMSDYFEDVVRSGMSPEVYQALMEVSVCERFSAELLAAMPQSGCSWALIEEQIRSGLFVRYVDAGRQWVMLHKAFGDHLRHRLRQTRPERYAELRCFAASWFEAHGYTAEAVRHAVTLADTPVAARIIENTGAIAVDVANGPDVAIEYLPPQQAVDFPLLFLGQLYHRIRTGRQREAEANFKQACALTEHFTKVNADVEPGVIRAWVHTIDTVFCVSRDMPCSEQQIDALEAEIQIHRDSDPVLAAGMATVLAAIYLDLGRYADAATICSIGQHMLHSTIDTRVMVFVRIHQAHAAVGVGSVDQAVLYIEDGCRLARVDGSGNSYEVLTSQMLRGALHYETNALDEALVLLHPLLEKLRITNGWLRLYDEVYAAVAAIINIQQGLLAVERVLSQGEGFARYRNLPRLMNMLTITRLRELIRAGELRVAKALMEDSPLSELLACESLSPHVLYQQIPAQLEAARLMLELGHPRDAMQSLDAINKSYLAEADSRLRFTFHALAMRATHGLRRNNAAIEHMQAAIELARSAGLIRRGLEERRHLLNVLDSALKNRRPIPSRVVDWANEVLREAQGAEADDSCQQSSLPRRRRQVVESCMLSPRESEIIALIAEGCINKEIALRLGISEGTVKGYRKTIHEKLGVTSRSQAITRARELLII